MESKKIVIEYSPASCVGNKECVKNDPALFGFNEQARKAILKDGNHAGNLVTVEVSGSPERITRAIKAAASCPVNAFLVKDAHSNAIIIGNTVNEDSLREIVAQYDDAKEFVLDPRGYFLIRINHEKQEIEVGFCNSKNNMVLKVTGKRPIDIYHTVANQAKLDLRPEHYAYLGRELEKAYHCLVTNVEYVQDDELHTMRPRKKID